MNKVNCPHCQHTVNIKQDLIGKIHCPKCKNQIFNDRILEIYVPCPRCKLTNTLPAFGWEVKACKGCGNQIIHPTAKSRGSHLKGNGTKNNKRFTMMLPDNNMQQIEELAEQMNTTSASVIRYMCRICLNMLY